MKRFILKTILLILLALIVCTILPVFMWKTGMYEKFVSGKDVYISIHESKKQHKQKKLIIGDSVAHQLFPNTKKDSTFVSLACNQAIEIPGHYFLLNNYLKAGNQVDTVYLIFHPCNLKNNLDQIYTFHYFIKPFYTAEYKPYFTKTLHEQVEKIPYYQMAKWLHIRTSNWAPDFKRTNFSSDFLSPLSIEYLNRMKLLADEYHFQLILLSPPISPAKKECIDSIDSSIITLNGFDNEFKHYFESIIYVEEHCFFDGFHFKEEYIEQYERLFREKL